MITDNTIIAILQLYMRDYFYVYSCRRMLNFMSLYMIILLMFLSLKLLFCY